MSSLGTTLLASIIVLGVSEPAFAQPEADAGSGQTSGAASRLGLRQTLPRFAGVGQVEGITYSVAVTTMRRYCVATTHGAR